MQSFVLSPIVGRQQSESLAMSYIYSTSEPCTLSLTKEQNSPRNKEQRHLRPISHLIFTNEQHHLRPISHGLLLRQWATPSTTNKPWTPSSPMSNTIYDPSATPSSPMSNAIYTTNQPLHLHQWATPSPHDEECAPTLVDFVNRGNKMSNWLKRAPPPPLPPPHSTFFP